MEDAKWLDLVKVALGVTHEKPRGFVDCIIQKTNAEQEAADRERVLWAHVGRAFLIATDPSNTDEERDAAIEYATLMAKQIHAAIAADEILLYDWTETYCDYAERAGATPEMTRRDRELVAARRLTWTNRERRRERYLAEREEGRQALAARATPCAGEEPEEK